jgi:glycosyltransferase involved in cell wall biosynthesis
MSTVLLIASLASSLTRFRGELIDAIIRRGHKVVACAPEPDLDTVSKLAQRQVEVVGTELQRASINPFADLSYMLRLRGVIADVIPDVVLAYTPKPVIYSGLACRKFPKVRHCALISGLGYGFGSESLGQRVLSRIMSRLYQVGLARSRAVIFQNPDDIGMFVDRRLVARDRAVLVAGSGVNTETFAPASLPETPTFLMMARLIPEKGVREYVAAARIVRSRVPAARFLLAGWLESRKGAITADEVRGWHEAGVIEYLGALDDVRPALARASIYVLPSYYREGVPRSVLEALSMERAIITTDMPGCRETVLPGDNGLLVQPHDITQLSNAMLELARDPDKVRRMAANSRQLAERRFSIGTVNQAMLDAMEL